MNICLVGGFVVLLEIMDPRVLIPLTLVRMAVFLVEIVGRLGPARAWGRGATLDDDQLVQLDAELADFPSSFGRTYALGWGACLGLALLGAALGIPTALGVATIDLLAVLLFLPALVVTHPTLLSALLDRQLLGARHDLRRELLARGRAPQAERTTLTRRLVGTHMGMVAAVFVGIVTTATLLRADRLRAEGETAALALATEGAIAVLAGRDRAEPGAEPGAEDQAEPGVEPGVKLVATDALVPALAALLPERAPSASISVIVPGQERAYAAVEIDQTRWAMATVEIDQKPALVISLGVAFLIAALTPGVVSSFDQARVLTDPLRQLELAAQRMTGKGELLELVPVVSLNQDEIGALADSFNQMLATLQLLAIRANQAAAGDLRVEIEGDSQLHDAIRTMLAQLDQLTTQLHATALEAASAASEIHATTRAQELSVDQQSQRMLVVSETVATLAQGAEEISISAQDVLANAEGAAATSDALTEATAALESATGRIGELLESIHEIADRSDLLALNGALEATRAGEAGRGFALVAAEMRRLAERIGGTVVSVRARVDEIETACRATVDATERSRRLATDTANAARNISRVTQRQNADTEQVSIEVFEVAEAMIATAAGSKQTQAAADGLRRQAEELERLTAHGRLLKFDPAARPDGSVSQL